MAVRTAGGGSCTAGLVGERTGRLGGDELAAGWVGAAFCLGVEVVGTEAGAVGASLVVTGLDVARCRLAGDAMGCAVEIG